MLVDMKHLIFLTFTKNDHFLICVASLVRGYPQAKKKRLSGYSPQKTKMKPEDHLDKKGKKHLPNLPFAGFMLNLCVVLTTNDEPHKGSRGFTKSYHSPSVGLKIMAWKPMIRQVAVLGAPPSDFPIRWGHQLFQVARLGLVPFTKMCYIKYIYILYI